MSVVGVIPMKGHSERVPGKNMRHIAGKPLFHWITDSLLKADLIDDVLVDTDSDEIESAVREGFPEVTVHRRSEHLHGDLVPMHDVVAELARSVPHDHLLQTHTTNPLLASDTIDRAIKAYLEDEEHDSLMSVTPWRTRFYLLDGTPVNHDPARLIRTQDLPPLLEENSNIYLAPVAQIRETGLRVGRRPLLFEIEAAEALDIDEELDFEIAEFLLRRGHGG